MRLITGHITLILLIILINLPNPVVSQGHVITQYYDNDKQLIKERYVVSDSLSMVLHGDYCSYYQNGKIKSKGKYYYNQPSGVWTFFYENGNFKMKGELIANKHCGFWEYFYENGQLSMEGNLNDGLREGRWKFYYEGGLIKSEGDFTENIKDGIWNYFYEDGALKAQAFYNKGKGIYKEFYTSGSVKMEGRNSDGVSDSTWTYYYEDGTVQAKGNYLNGLRHGFWTFYHDNGKESAEGFYQNGERNGNWKYFYPNGNISSEGEEKSGKKEGQWKLYDTSGELKGEGVFEGGNGEYKEYYGNGNLKISGQMRNGKNQGEWTYYYDDGTLEGECNFDNGEGIYTGYYPNGKMRMRGKIVNGNRTGQWELYEEDGSLAGYYKPVYEDEKPIFKVIDEQEEEGERVRIDYMKPEYLYKNRKSRYFTPIINEFKGFIIATNPAAVLIGSIPISGEYFIHQRLGFELQSNIFRDPFFSRDKSIDVNTLYNRGFDVAIRQKFYHEESGFGMFYFAHELRYTNKHHFFNAQDTLLTPIYQYEVQSIENKIEYSILIGDRWLRIFGERWSVDAKKNGFTLDTFLGFGIGYRDFEKKYNDNEFYDKIFQDLRQEKFAYALRLGINIGYAF